MNSYLKYSQNPITGSPISGKSRYPDENSYSIRSDIRIRLSNTYSESGYRLDCQFDNRICPDHDCSVLHIPLKWAKLTCESLTKISTGFLVFNPSLALFILVQVPFPLTLRFKPMLQRGIELLSLDAAWVSSASW